jgi:hypothetical protein
MALLGVTFPGRQMEGIGRRGRVYIAVQDVLDLWNAHLAVARAAGLGEIAEYLEGQITELRKLREEGLGR